MALSEKFPRIFEISLQRDETIEHMGIWEGENRAWKFRWRRRFFSWEENMPSDLLQWLDGTKLEKDVDDKVVWGEGVDFSVKGCYKALQAASHPMEIDALSNIWKRLGPLKGKAFVWLASLNRIFSKGRLDHLRLLGNDTLQCP